MTYLHNLSCFNLCFNRKLLQIPRYRPIVILALISLLAGDVNLNYVFRRTIRLATANIRSIRESTAFLIDLLISKTIDILAITETRLRSQDTVACIAGIFPPDYASYHRPHLVGRGGDIGFLISKLFKVNLHNSPDNSRFECVC